MAKLHPTRWPELGPEMRAASLLREAHEVLTGVSTHGASGSRVLVGQALRALHPACSDPESCAEFEARQAGTFGQPEAPTPSAPDARDDTIARLRARLAELESSEDPANPEG